MPCPRCSECPDGPHHWIPNDEERDSSGAPDYICKHCDTGYGWACMGCDAVNAEPDTNCAECAAEDAEYEADYQ